VEGVVGIPAGPQNNEMQLTSGRWARASLSAACS
jgi:hypothetical protein